MFMYRHISQKSKHMLFELCVDLGIVLCDDQSQADEFDEISSTGRIANCREALMATWIADWILKLLERESATSGSRGIRISESEMSFI
jgi:hypothetical protein